MALDVSRRGLIGMLAVGVSAAIVRPGILMPIKPKLVFHSRPPALDEVLSALDSYLRREGQMPELWFTDRHIELHEEIAALTQFAVLGGTRGGIFVRGVEVLPSSLAPRWIG